MSKLSQLKKGLKRTAAAAMVTLMASTCVDASLLTVNAASGNASVLSNEERGVIYANSRTDFRDESIYFLITTRFYDGDPSNNVRTSDDDKAKNPESDPSWRGDFKGLIEKLDYIKALGFTAIWITPVVENKSGYDYHGYHAYDFSAVDNRYESNGITYQDLIDAVHAKGMKLIQDVVLNHTCNWGEKNLLQINDPVYSGGRSDYVMPSGASKDPDNIYHHNGFCGGPDWDNYSAQNKTIHDDCFDLETENPKVYNYLVDCYTKYINMGVDAFRIDTMRHISRLTYSSVFEPAFRKAGGDNFYMFGEVCTKGHDVWYREQPPISCAFYTWGDDSSWTSRWSNDLATNESLVEQHYVEHSDMSKQPTSDNAFLKGNEYHTPDYSKSSGMNVIDFQMHWSFYNANNAYNMALNEDKYFNDSTWNVVYVDSHDYAPDECQTLRYTGGTDAWAENLDLMFTFRGIPCIFYGTEIEFQAGKTIDGGPDGPLSTKGRAYYGDHMEGTVGTNDFTVFGNVSGEVQNTLNSTLSQHIMRLNRIRQAIPALRKGQYSTEGCSGNMAFKRRYTDSSTDSFVCVAISGNATFTGIPNGKYVDAITGDVQNVSGGTLTANVSGKGNMKVYVLDTAKTPAPGRIITNGKYLTDGGSAELIGPVDIEVVKPTGITLDKSSVSILEQQTEKISATVAPSNATNKTVTWTSSDTSVATVSGGTVTGIAPGTATITATTSNGLTATATVKVSKNPDIVNPTGIELDKTSLTVKQNATETLTATVKPSNATNKTVTWTSSDTSVATVSSDGVVTGKSEGTATITAETFNGFKATATVTVLGKTLPSLDKGIYFEKPSGWGSNINVYMYDSATDSTVGAGWPGEKMTDAGDGIYTYNYDTSSTTLKIVFNDGSNQAPSTEGFEYKNKGYYNSSGLVRVVGDDVAVTSVTINPTSAKLKIGDTYSLNATVAPANATNKTITWTSSDSSVATVSSSGQVKAVSAGTATITATSSNGKTAKAVITVAGVENGTVYVQYVDQNGNILDSTTLTGAIGTSYKTSAKQFSNYTLYSTPSNASGKYTVADIIVKYVYKATSVAELKNKSTVSTSTINLGSTVTLKGAASGGKAPYKYAYYYRKASSSKWTTVKGFSTTATATIKPAAATKYDVCIKVKDAKGTIARKYFTVNVTAALINKSTVSATTINLGSTVTLKGSATGGKAPYKYAYYYRKASSSKWTTVKGFSTTATTTIKPAAATKYDVCIKVKDAKGTIARKYFTVNVTAALINKSTVSATSINLGSTVALKGSATGGKAPYKYAYYYRKASSSKWTTVKGFSTTATTTIKPAAATKYDVCIKVKDAKGTIARKYFTVNVKAALTNKSTVSATSINLGSTVTLKGSATGGKAPYQYAYFYKKVSSSKWTTVKGFSTTATATIKPAAATKYDVCIKVKDAKGTIVRKYFTVNVTAALTNKSTVSAYSITKGSSVTVSCAASNGTAPYYYMVKYMKAGTGQWTTVQKYSSNKTVKITPASIGTYSVSVIVQDMTGKTSVKYLTVTVK